MRSFHRSSTAALAVALSLPALAAGAGAASAASGYAAPDAGAVIARSPKTGLVTWMSGSPQRPVSRALADGANGDPTQSAAAFLDSQSAAFGLRQGRGELSTMKATPDGSGNNFVRFQQRYRGVPILGAELTVQMDGTSSVISANARTVGDLNMSVQPDVASADAAKIAVEAVARRQNAPIADLVASTPELVVHDPRVVGGPDASPALAWRVNVSSAKDPAVAEFVAVDANNGRIRMRYSLARHEGPPANATQVVCDANSGSIYYPCPVSAAVPSPATSSVGDVKLAFTYAETTYDFYANRFKRNSLDGGGLPLVSTVRYRLNYQNAFWSGVYHQMTYGAGFASALDVVGHELTHGFTEFSSNLAYYYQSGAVDESISDVFGELIQRAAAPDKEDNWDLGEDLPPSIGVIRNMKNPPAYDQPDKMTSTLWTADTSYYDYGGVHTNSGVGNKAAYLITDGGSFNGKTVKGLGIDKTIAIYYRVNAFLLQSGSDYADLGLALQQACKDLVGAKPKKGSGAAGKVMKSEDCDQVAKAVAAVEMSKQPLYNPIPTEAKVCSGKDTPKNKVFEDFEATDIATFKFKPVVGYWALANDYAVSNKRSYVGYGSGAFDDSLAATTATKLPKDAFLRFAHYYGLYKTYNGGVVEYSLDNGASWVQVPPTMFKENPYNGVLVTGTSNPLAGKAAFTGFSGGWTSSRIDLSSLAGKTVKFRFRVATSTTENDGWWVDDVRIYACKDPKKDIASAE